jgi:hypothetical protein
LGVLLLQSSLRAAGSHQLRQVFEQICNAKLDTSTTLDLHEFILSHKDLKVHFDSGRIAFCEPVRLDNDTVAFAAYFEGSGSFQFAPQSPIERQQLFRYFHTDSLNRKFSSLTLLFSSEVRDSIASAGVHSASPFKIEAREALANSIAGIRANARQGGFFETLRSLSTPIGGPFLLVDVEPRLTDRLYYIFDPYMREEVRLYKRLSRDSSWQVELVSSYSQYLDSSYHSINGLSKEQIVVSHYLIDAAVDKHGVLNSRADVTFNVTRGPFQLLPMMLRTGMQVDSVKDAKGRQIGFSRYDDKYARTSPCDLYFDNPLAFGDTLTLSFFYHGNIADSRLSDFFVSTQSDWYPKYAGYRQRAVFEITFRTPASYSLIASGNLLDQSVVEDTLVSRWKVLPPVENVTFSIGSFHTYTTDVEGTAKVVLHFSRRLHEEMATALNSKQILPDSALQQQVGSDMVNSIRLFSHYYGPYPYRVMSADEIPAISAPASPELVHLGFDTWREFDGYGKNRMSRFKEAARQWWGVGVGYQTYHDQWLSDGFAMYGALLYLQAAEGNDQFIDMIREYRNDIFTARKYVPGSGEESGPIALGCRTASSGTADVGNLVVFKKAALVLHMLRNLLIDFKTMKEDAFFGMLSEFYQSNRGKNVSTADFERLTEKYTGIKMDWFFRQFVYGNDLPTYDFSYDYEPDSSGSVIAHGHIVTTGVGSGFKMYVPLEIQIDDVNRAYVRLFVDTSDYVFTLPSLPKKPRRLVLNPFESVLAKVRVGQ